MSAAISAQAGFWLYAAALGAALLFFYDLLRILRRAVPHGVAAVGIEDFVYWLICGCLIFAMLYRFNNGVIRWFAVFGMLVGMLLYHLTLSTVFVRYASRLLKYSLQILRRVLRFAKRIVREILRCMKKCFGVPTNRNKRHKKVTNSLKKRLKSGEKEGKMRQEAGKGSDTVGKERKRASKSRKQKARQTCQTEQTDADEHGGGWICRDRTASGTRYQEHPASREKRFL